MNNNRYIDVTPKRNANIPGRRVLLKNPITGSVVNRTNAARGFKWVYDKSSNKFNQIPINKNMNMGPVTQDPRIESWWEDSVDLATIDRLFPIKNMNSRGIKFTPLRPSLYGLNVKFTPVMTKDVFSDLAFNLTSRPFVAGVERVVVRGGSPWRVISDVKTKAQQNSITKNMFVNARRRPSRIDVTMNGINIQIFRSSMLVNGGYKKDIEIPSNKINGRVILGDGLDILEKFMKKYIPTKQTPYQDYFVTTMNLDFYVNQQITDPVAATQLGRGLYRNMRKFIKDNKRLDNDVARLLPSFEYDLENMNFVMEERNLGIKTKIPDNIFLKFVTDKNKGKKRGGSYVAWKKGYVRIQGADSLSKILLIAKTVKAWYLDMKRSMPELLVEKPFGKRGKRKVGRAAPKGNNIEKMKNVRLEYYKGHKGVKKLKIDGIRCDDTSKTGFTTKQLRAIAERKLIPGAAKLKREVICKKLYNMVNVNVNKNRKVSVNNNNKVSANVNSNANKNRNVSVNNTKVQSRSRSRIRSRSRSRSRSSSVNMGAGVGMSRTPSPLNNNPNIEKVDSANAENLLAKEFNNLSVENELNLRNRSVTFREDLSNGNRQCIKQLENKGFTVTAGNPSAQEKGEKLLNNIMYKKQRNEVRNENFVSIYIRIEKATEEYNRLRAEFGDNDRRTRDSLARLRGLQNAYNSHLTN